MDPSKIERAYNISDAVKPCLKGPLKKTTKVVYKTDYHLIQVKSIAECTKRTSINTGLDK